MRRSPADCALFLGRRPWSRATRWMRDGSARSTGGTPRTDGSIVTRIEGKADGKSKGARSETPAWGPTPGGSRAQVAVAGGFKRPRRPVSPSGRPLRPTSERLGVRAAAIAELRAGLRDLSIRKEGFGHVRVAVPAGVDGAWGTPGPSRSAAIRSTKTNIAQAHRWSSSRPPCLDHTASMN